MCFCSVHVYSLIFGVRNAQVMVTKVPIISPPKQQISLAPKRITWNCLAKCYFNINLNILCPVNEWITCDIFLLQRKQLQLAGIFFQIVLYTLSYARLHSLFLRSAKLRSGFLSLSSAFNQTLRLAPSCWHNSWNFTAGTSLRPLWLFCPQANAATPA